MSTNLLTIRSEMVVAKLAKHPKSLLPNCSLVAQAFFETSERFCSRLEKDIAPKAGLAVTQASQFETRIWCLFHLTVLMSDARQPYDSSMRCLDAIGDCIIFEYLHGEVTADALRTSTQVLNNRPDEYDRRWQNADSGGNPFGWFWICLRSAESGTPRTATDPIVLENALQSHFCQMELADATKTFRDAIQPLFEGTNDFTALPPTEFERRVKESALARQQ